MFFYNLITSGSSPSDIIIAAFAFVVSALFAIIMHECAHGYVALLMGDDTAKTSGRLTLNPRAHFDLLGLFMFLLVGFGWAKPVPINSSRFRRSTLGKVLVSLAGVVTNILIAGILLLVLYLTAGWAFFEYPTDTTLIIVLKTALMYILIYGIQINLMLAMFNFLPIFPLDGFNFVNSLLPYGNRFSQFMYRYGAYCLIGLVLIGNVLDMVGLGYLDIFNQFSSLISSLISVTIAGGIA